MDFHFRRITDDLATEIPNLETLVLTGNNLTELGDIDPLAKLQSLTTLSLLTNPLASKKHYREYLIFK
jgi:U2 small nuclear ribonucleoprotein A'